jgi:TusE/DsrC/DsvC family sulfur relay protein
MKIEQLMTKSPKTCRPDDSMGEAVRMMWEAKVRRLPVIDESEGVIGLIGRPRARSGPGARARQGVAMGDFTYKFTYKDKAFEVDSDGFLVSFDRWDESFAEGMAPQLGIPHGLTREHWDVIHFIRNTYKETGRCPLVYETCRMNGLRRKELKKLFPTGHLRGACKLAGITYREGYLGQTYLPGTADDLNIISVEKTYEVDVRGFLVNPDDWDEYYAVYRAYDMKIPGGKISEKQWQIIRFLRESFKQNDEVPTVYETCEANQIDLEELEQLFPDGYHRGAVKIAGLRVR